MSGSCPSRRGGVRLRGSAPVAMTASAMVGDVESGGVPAKPLDVLFVHYGDEWVRGSEILLMDLIRGLDPARVRPTVWCNGRELAAMCERAGWRTIRSDFDLYLDYLSPAFDRRRYVGLVRQALDLIDRIGADVVHLNSAGPGQWALPAAMMRRVPSVVHLHNEYLPRSRIVLLTHAATRVVGVSKQVLEGLLSDGLDPASAQVIYNGIDVSRIAPSSKDLRAVLGIPPGAVVVASAGSLIRRKGYDVLIRAFARIDAVAPPHLLIAGGGEELAALESLAADLGVRDRVHFVGQTSDMASVYQAADVFALASRAEAFGLVFAEAGHFGLPVCATAVGGVPEVVLDGVTGLLVSPDDVVVLADALTRLVADEQLRRRLGDAGRERVRAVFSLQEMVRGFMALYDSMKSAPSSKAGLAGAIRLFAPVRAIALRKLSRR